MVVQVLMAVVAVLHQPLVAAAAALLALAA
jgi:hypothetical protein